MAVALAIRRRLVELGLEQKDLARAVNVTESYISQMLSRRKLPPDPSRTNIYERMELFLKLPAGALARLADAQRRAEPKGGRPAPLFPEVRELMLRKCKRHKVPAVRAVFEKQPFGELERLVRQKLLEIAGSVAQEGIDNARWLNVVVRAGGGRQEEARSVVLDVLGTDASGIPAEECVAFLEPLIEWWDIDLGTFDLTIVLNDRVAPGGVKRFWFAERGPEEVVMEEGLKELLADPALSLGATEEEVGFLKRLRFEGKRPTALFYYRSLQNLRDPLHFLPAASR